MEQAGPVLEEEVSKSRCKLHYEFDSGLRLGV